jgi:alpha-galactosidase
MRTATPPMGWNSWDCFGTTVTEDEVLSNAEFMAEHLSAFGWDTVVVDIDWSDPDARAHGYNPDAALSMDGFGRLVPDTIRFPSARNGAGFRPLADRVHALGLRFGIHTMRGIPRRAVAAALPIEGSDATAADVSDAGNRCDRNPDMLGLRHDHPGAQAYYDSTLRLYAEWGVDFIKSDDMLWPYQAADIEAYARAIERSGRDIQLSLSPGRDLSLARVDHLRRHATMWRICDDLWDRWEDVEANFERFAIWAPLAGPEGWPDGDMLPIGRIGIRAERGEPRQSRLTPDEQRTLLTLWVMARSPLMIGGDLPSSTPDVMTLLTNSEVLSVLSTSSRNRQVFRGDDLVFWAADGPAGERFAAVFNLAAEPRRTILDTANIGFPERPEHGILDLWSGRRVLGTPVGMQTVETRGVAPGSTAIAVDIAAHGTRLLRYRPS